MAHIPGHKVSPASDIWAFAMVVIEVLFPLPVSFLKPCLKYKICKMLTTKLPFPDLSNYGMLVIALNPSGRKRAVRPKRPDVPECCDALWNLLGRCWQDNQNDRPSSAEVLQVVGPLILPQIQRLLKALCSAPRSGPHEA